MAGDKTSPAAARSLRNDLIVVDGEPRSQVADLDPRGDSPHKGWLSLRMHFHVYLIDTEAGEFLSFAYVLDAASLGVTACLAIKGP